MRDAVELLGRESALLVQRLRLWTPQRWQADAGTGRTRADVVHHLAQWLADTAARLEGQPGRPLPRLASDLALADQLAVTADDLLRAAPDRELAARAAAHLLAHRHELLGDAVPAAVEAALGLGDVLAAGRQECA